METQIKLQEGCHGGGTGGNRSVNFFVGTGRLNQTPGGYCHGGGLKMISFRTQASVNSEASHGAQIGS